MSAFLYLIVGTSVQKGRIAVAIVQKFKFHFLLLFSFICVVTPLLPLSSLCQLLKPPTFIVPTVQCHLFDSNFVWFICAYYSNYHPCMVPFLLQFLFACYRLNLMNSLVACRHLCHHGDSVWKNPSNCTSTWGTLRSWVLGWKKSSRWQPRMTMEKTWTTCWCCRRSLMTSEEKWPTTPLATPLSTTLGASS